MVNESQLNAELEAAAQTLTFFAGQELDFLTLQSNKRQEASFLATVVSKLSPLVGNYMELKIADILNENAGPGFEWRRQDPGFPDAVLTDVATGDVLAGYEVKAWFVLSTEITGRFRESLNLLRDKNINIVIVAWCMSSMVFGKPTILGTLVVSGEEIAISRDTHYHNPPEYLTIEPLDTTSRTANLQQSNVNGYRLQTEQSDPAILREAREATYLADPPHTVDVQIESRELMNKLSYRLDTNFAKIDRINNKDVAEFKADIMESQFLGKTLTQWKSIFSDLVSKNVRKQRSAKAEIDKLYDALLSEEIKTSVAQETRDAH